MKNKRIVVTLKYFKGELNPFDGAALEFALQTGAEVIVVSMAPTSVLNVFQSVTRLGVRAILVSDPAYAGSDTLATARTLAEAIKRLSPDFVFCGRQSIDGDTAQVPPCLAEILGFEIVPRVVALNDTRATLRDGTAVLLIEKTVVTFERSLSLRFPSIFSKMKEVEHWDNGVLKLPLDKCGQKGSPTRVIKSYESTIGRRDCQFVCWEELKGLIENGRKRSDTVKECGSGEKMNEIYFVGKIEGLAKRLAQKAIPLSIEGKTPESIARELSDKRVKSVVWEDSEELKILAPKVAFYAEAGLCADCISFREQNEKWIMTRPAFGGNITADIVCDSPISMATVRTAKKDRSDVIFSIGKGAVHKIEEIKRLSLKYDAEICCSRSVVDNGYLPYLSQVGLTGRTVCPKVYVAFGVSGAVQHTCAIERAGTVIAVNSDKNARIFEYADFGIVKVL